MKNLLSNSFLTKMTLLLCSSLAVMQGSIIQADLPLIKEHFLKQHFASESSIGFWVTLIITLPYPFISISSLISGIVLKQLGRKKFLVGAILIYGLAGSSEFISDSLPVILLERSILGLSVAGILVCTTTLIADYYVGVSRAAFMGLRNAFMGLCSFAFSSIGGFLAGVNWRIPFLSYFFAWLLLPVIFLYIYEPQINNSTNSNQLKNKNHLNFRTPWKFLILNWGISIFGSMMSMLNINLNFYLYSTIQLNPAEIGITIAFFTLSGSITAMNYGWIRKKVDEVMILVLIFLLMSIGYIVIGLFNNQTSIVIGLVLAGLGNGFLLTNLMTWLLDTVSDDVRVLATSGLYTCITLGQFVSPLISVPLSQKIGLPLTYSFASIILLIVGILIIMFRPQLMAFSKSVQTNQTM